MNKGITVTYNNPVGSSEGLLTSVTYDICGLEHKGGDAWLCTMRPHKDEAKLDAKEPLEFCKAGGEALILITGSRDSSTELVALKTLLDTDEEKAARDIASTALLTT